MAFLGQSFNPNQVEPTQSNEPFAAGDYKLVLVASEILETKNRDGKYLKCEFTVLEGASKGRKVWQNFNLWNKNVVAKEIAFRQLGDLCRACGYYRDLQDSSALHNIPFMAHVGIRKGNDGYRDSNEIKEYYSRPSSGVAATATAEQPKEETQKERTTQPATDSVPPWLQNA